MGVRGLERAQPRGVLQLVEPPGEAHEGRSAGIRGSLGDRAADEPVQDRAEGIGRLQDLALENIDAARPAIRRYYRLAPLEPAIGPPYDFPDAIEKLGPILAAILLIGLTTCGINAIPTAEENAKAKWADVEAQYQRRADLIPNLVRTVQAFGLQERQVLTDVTEARARATSVQVDPSNPQAVQNFAAAQNALGQSLGRLLVTASNGDRIPLDRLARRHGCTILATNDVHYHAPDRRPLQDVMACIREKTTLDHAGRRLLAPDDGETIWLEPGRELLVARLRLARFLRSKAGHQSVQLRLPLRVVSKAGQLATCRRWIGAATISPRKV